MRLNEPFISLAQEKKNEKKGGDGRSKGGKCTEVARVIACINHAGARQRKALLPS